MLRRRSNISANLRRLRALRVAVGERRFRWRAYDRRGRYPHGLPRVCRTEVDCLRSMHTWLDRQASNVSKWWFAVEEIALDCHGDYGLVVNHSDVLVFRDDLFGEPIRDFSCPNRREAIRG